MPEPVWSVAGKHVDFHGKPLVMGILNVTPDSFSDGGLHSGVSAAVSHAEKLIEEGADVIDVGGESTRPGAPPVDETEELGRTVEIVRAVSALGRPVSIDTTKAVVARACLDAGAQIVNDISGLTFDPQMPATAAASNCGVICMHIQGTPLTMQANPHYDNVVADVREWLRERIAVLTSAGIGEDRIALDPGIGFGKTAAHNVRLLREIGELRALGRPVLVGHSRKRFIGKIAGRKLDERLAGTVGVSVAMAAAGVEMLRVHDVAATRDAVAAFRAVCPG